MLWLLMLADFIEGKIYVIQFSARLRNGNQCRVCYVISAKRAKPTGGIQRLSLQRTSAPGGATPATERAQREDAGS